MVAFVDCQFSPLRQGERIKVRGFGGQLSKAFGFSYLQKEPSPSPLPARERRPTTNFHGFLFTQAGVNSKKRGGLNR